jgi:hypothetical protein
MAKRKAKADAPNFDEVFSNGHWAIKVNTVEEAINELKRLPPGMPVRKENEGVDIVVFNRPGSEGAAIGAETHVGFEDGGEWDDWDGNGDADNEDYEDDEN